ncbi:MAG: ABC-F family ATP-binding cassette domain-containing protein [Oscillospiraceae bacterium]|nr:ABC-F family ATP-binding cassette domain-containing protein [Oscillospiraceae bacterium]
MLVSLENAAKSFGAEEIFFGVTASVEPGDRIGLIGANGAGKTTLLGVLTGELEADEGSVSRQKGITIGYLKQNSGLDYSNSIREEMRSVFAETLALEARMNDLTARMNAGGLSPAQQEELAKEFAHVQELYEVGEGYQIDVKINTVLSGMGFAGEDMQKSVEFLSGGEKTRLAICKLLLEDPDLLILDEPTNHLDFRTLLWLEEYLAGYRGALLIVSHDRYFLDRLVNKVWEIENTRFYTYKGNYTKYVQLKEERVARQLKEYELQQQEIAAMQDYVDRNIVRATTSTRAKSRLKALQRMERVERPTLPPTPMKLRFETEREPVKDVLTTAGLELAVGENAGRKVLARDVELEVKRGEKVAIVGTNGTGKTTLLKAIQNMIPATGRVTWGKNTRLAYFDQGTDSLNGSNTVLEEIHSTYPSSYEQQIRSILGWVGLSGEDAFKTVGKLSGGECARLKFAIMMMRKGNVLILDEPTNHLDLSAKEVLDRALRDFEGTIIMVSHDRYLLDRVPTRIIEMSGSRLLSYKGGFTNYMEYADLKPRKEPAPQAEAPKENKGGREYNRGKEARKAEAKRRKALAETEQAVQDSEALIARLEEELATPEVQSDFVRLEEICSQLDEERNRLSALMDDWLELQGEE